MDPNIPNIFFVSSADKFIFCHDAISASALATEADGKAYSACLSIKNNEPVVNGVSEIKTTNQKGGSDA